jgi:hypothetical protein
MSETNAVERSKLREKRVETNCPYSLSLVSSSTILGSDYARRVESDYIDPSTDPYTYGAGLFQSRLGQSRGQSNQLHNTYSYLLVA